MKQLKFETSMKNIPFALHFHLYPLVAEDPSGATVCTTQWNKIQSCYTSCVLTFYIFPLILNSLIYHIIQKYCLWSYYCCMFSNLDIHITDKRLSLSGPYCSGIEKQPAEPQFTEAMSAALERCLCVIVRAAE